MYTEDPLNVEFVDKVVGDQGRPMVAWFLDCGAAIDRQLKLRERVLQDLNNAWQLSGDGVLYKCEELLV